MAHRNIAGALTSLNRYEEAIEHKKRVFELNPESRTIYGSILTDKMHICDWADFDQISSAIISDVKAVAASVRVDLPALRHAWLRFESHRVRARQAFVECPEDAALDGSGDPRRVQALGIGAVGDDDAGAASLRGGGIREDKIGDDAEDARNDDVRSSISAQSHWPSGSPHDFPS